MDDAQHPARPVKELEDLIEAWATVVPDGLPKNIRQYDRGYIDGVKHCVRELKRVAVNMQEGLPSSDANPTS